MGQALCVKGGLVGLSGSCSFARWPWKSPAEEHRKELGRGTGIWGLECPEKQSYCDEMPPEP